MKKFLILLGAALWATPTIIGAPLQSATVTKVINDVRIFEASTAAKVAQLGDTIRGKSSLQTGRRSRSELRFQDETITRLGANSIFSFERGTRDLALEQGTLLLSVPRGAGGARIRTATVTAAVTGTSILMEYYVDKWVKIIVLEGSLETWLEREGRKQKKTIKAGQMMILKANDKRMPNPVDIDLARLFKTCGLADEQEFGPLPQFARNDIMAAINKQAGQKRVGILVPVIDGTGPGGGEPAEVRSSDTIQIITDSIPPPEEPRDPGNDRPTEGDDP